MPLETGLARLWGEHRSCSRVFEIAFHSSLERKTNHVSPRSLSLSIAGSSTVAVTRYFAMISANDQTMTKP